LAKALPNFSQANSTPCYYIHRPHLFDSQRNYFTSTIHRRTHIPIIDCRRFTGIVPDFWPGIPLGFLNNPFQMAPNPPVLDVLPHHYRKGGHLNDCSAPRIVLDGHRIQYSLHSSKNHEAFSKRKILVRTELIEIREEQTDEVVSEKSCIHVRLSSRPAMRSMPKRT
jgi:hypothetical protein